MKNFILTLQLFSLAVILPSCTYQEANSVKEIKDKVVSSAPDKQSSIVKSVIDLREYQSITLANQLEVMLVSDPSIEKSAAALSVAVGSFQEPKDFGGLAHYLEHMLFLGTKTYPVVGEYSEFLTHNGGFNNAYTALDHTNYVLSVNNNAFEEALKRFSGFFYEPLLSPKYADKERNAVHSEWTMKSPNDHVILGQLDGLTLSNKHPISQFNWGNLESLSDKESAKLQSVLVDFYNQYYSANIMKATLISNLPMMEMKKLATQYFGLIPNHNIPKPEVKSPVAQATHLNKIVRYLPQTEMKELRVKFVIEKNNDEFAVKPNKYVSYLISNEMAGTLAPTLRDMGLTESLYAYAEADEYGNAGSFTINAALTEKGLKNRDVITGLIFKYIELIKHKGVDEKYFTEIKQSLSNEFRFKEKSNDYSYAWDIAGKMQKIPTNYVLSSQYEYQRFSSEAIKSLLAQLTVENSRIFYIDKDQETDTSMRFFKGKYKIENISKNMLKQWQDAVTNISLNLPTPNALMPAKFDLVEKRFKTKPKALINEPQVNLHLAHSTNFEQPKGTFVANFNTNYSTRTARNSVLSQLLLKGINLELTTLQTEAYTAGMSINFYSYNGLELNVDGFTDKQPQLLEKAYKLILAYEATEDELANLKASYISEMKSKKKQMLIRQLFPNFRKLIYLNSYSDESLLAEVSKITAKELSEFRDKLLKSSRLNAFAFGNYSEEHAIKTTRYLESLLPSNRTASDIYFSKVVQPEAGQVINWQQDVELTDIAFLDAFFKPFNVEDLAAAKVLNQILRPALSNQIRTEEQLAYSVGFFNQSLREQLLMGFYIQSPAKGVSAIAQRIDLFKQNFIDKLANTSEEEFNTVKQSVLTTLNQPPKNLNEESRDFYLDWRESKLNFDSKAKLVAAVQTVDLAQVTALYQSLVSTSDFGRVTLQMRGTKFKDEAFVEFKGYDQTKVKQVVNIDEFHKQQLK